MTQRVATERVTGDQTDVDGHDDRTEPDSERYRSGSGILPPEGLPHVVREDDDEHQRRIQKIAMDVLQDQRKRLLTPIALARLTDGAGRGIRPERLVVRAAVVIARQPKAAGENQDEKGRRVAQRRRPPAWLGAEPGVRRVAEELGRIE